MTLKRLVILLFFVNLLNFCFANKVGYVFDEKIKNENTDILFPRSQELQVNFGYVDATCTSLGSASVNIISSTSGNPTISWSTGVTGNNISNLSAGSYSVTIVDIGSPNQIYSFDISSPSISVEITQSGSICAGNANITVLPNVPIGQCIFLWSSGQNTPVINVTTPDNYTISVTSGTCTTEASISVEQNNFFTVNYNQYLCEGLIASANVNFTDASSPNDCLFTWSPNGEISQDINITEVGSYSVNVINNITGCSDTKYFSVNTAPNIYLNIDAQDISCYGMNDGQIAVSAIDGYSTNFTYQWTTLSSNNEINNLPSGNYGLTVTSEIGCIKDTIIYINEPDLFSYTATNDTGFCAGTSATLHVYTEGGTSPFTYYWNDQPSNPVYASLYNITPTETFNYYVSVVDANGCTAQPQLIRVVVSPTITLVPTISQVTCYGLCNASVTLNINGGVPPMNYSWPSLTNTWNDLCVGNYNVSLTDFYGCTATTSFTVTQPDTMVIELDHLDASCYGYTDGFVSVSAYGGSPYSNGTYLYLWSTGQILDSMAAGTGYYTVTVTDSKNCKQIGSVFVNAPQQIYLTYMSNQTICIGESFDINVYATGGVGQYDFVWHGSDNSVWYGANFHASPITTTTYTVIATDMNGCPSMERAVTITVNPPLSIDSLAIDKNSICFGESLVISLEASGGNGGPFNYFSPNGNYINPPYNFSPIESGYYTFKVSDDCGTPEAKDSIYIVVNSLPDVAFNVDHLNSCPYAPYNFVEVHPDAGQRYLWNFGDGGISASKTPKYVYTQEGIYTVSCEVTDSNGCKAINTMTDLIEIYPQPYADFVSSPDIITIVDPFVTINNLSTGAEYYYWDYGDETKSFWESGTRQFHKYNELGEFVITLIAKSDKECYDTVSKTVFIRDKYTFYAPTVFTPNGDNKNDFFYVTGSGISRDNFSLIILDRFGHSVFQINEYNPDNLYETAWDGTDKIGLQKKREKALSNGIYVWRCKYIDINGTSHEETGTVMLLR